MDCIIYRTKTNRFVRFADGNVFLTSDMDELADELKKEELLSPIALSLSYKTDMGDGKESVTVYSANTVVGNFVCQSNENDFYKALDDFAKSFETNAENTLHE